MMRHSISSSHCVFRFFFLYFIFEKTFIFFNEFYLLEYLRIGDRGDFYDIFSNVYLYLFEIVALRMCKYS